MHGNKLSNYLPRSCYKESYTCFIYKSKISNKKAIEERLMVDPITFGKPLRYSLKGHRRLRVSDYRVVYRIENKSVIIIAIKHRKDIY